MLPVKVKSYAKGNSLRVINESPDALPDAVLRKSTADGHGGVQVLGAVAAQDTGISQYITTDLPLADAVTQAKQALKTGLVASGLYADEAQGMVDTWQKSWFATPGTRLLDILPQA